MSTLPNPAAEVSPQTGKSHVLTVHLFSAASLITWALVATLTIAPELLPIGPMPVPLFCSYYALKVSSFIALGFLAPLAFRSLNGIGLGLALSFLSALIIESLQGLLHNGHVFHWYELAGKLSLITLGFAVALDCRYEHKASLGPLQIKLLTENE
jgi:hypothetical protein